MRDSNGSLNESLGIRLYWESLPWVSRVSLSLSLDSRERLSLESNRVSHYALETQMCVFSILHKCILYCVSLFWMCVSYIVCAYPQEFVSLLDEQFSNSWVKSLCLFWMSKFLSSLCIADVCILYWLCLFWMSNTRVGCVCVCVCVCVLEQ